MNTHSHNVSGQKVRIKMKLLRTLWKALQRVAVPSTRPVIDGHYVARNDVMKRLMEIKDPKP